MTTWEMIPHFQQCLHPYKTENKESQKCCEIMNKKCGYMDVDTHRWSRRIEWKPLINFLFYSKVHSLLHFRSHLFPLGEESLNGQRLSRNEQVAYTFFRVYLQSLAKMCIFWVKRNERKLLLLVILSVCV